MIIGKDKERMQELEIENKLAKELIRQIRYDLDQISQNMRDENNVRVDEPWWRLHQDLGRCIGFLGEFDKKG